MAVPAIDLVELEEQANELAPQQDGLTPQPVELTPQQAGLAAVLEPPALMRLGQSAPTPAPDTSWSLQELQGRLCQLTPGPQSAVLSAAVMLVRQAQDQGEPAAWVSVGHDLVYAPDVAACGVDLAALPMVRARHATQAGRAADLLLRSGAFGLVVVDLASEASLPLPLQSRLVQLALKHAAAVVCLTRARPEAPSLGSLVSLRAAVSRRQVGPGRYVCQVEALKDKRQGPGWQWEGVWHGPDGLV